MHAYYDELLIEYFGLLELGDDHDRVIEWSSNGKIWVKKIHIV